MINDCIEYRCLKEKLPKGKIMWYYNTGNYYLGNKMYIITSYGENHNLIDLTKVKKEDTQEIIFKFKRIY